MLRLRRCYSIRTKSREIIDNYVDIRDEVWSSVDDGQLFVEAA